MSGPASHPLAFARDAMAGSVLGAAEAMDQVSFAGASTDSRSPQTGRLFFALPGERVDGFDFCAAAVKAGAVAVVVASDRGVPPGCGAAPVIGVADPRRALRALARRVRQSFKGTVVGITGSNGKTTTKELVATALGSAGRVLRTAGNLNTDVGLPLTVLEATGDEAFWVLEMAMRARGEISLLAEIARPQVGVVTNVAAAHLGRLGSLDEVARAKGEIFHGMTADGIAVLPLKDPRLEAEVAHLPVARQRRFGFTGDSAGDAFTDVRVMELVPAGVLGSVIRFSVAGAPVVVRLPLAGAHNARNAAAALAVASALRLPILPAAAALEHTALPAHRSRLVSIAGRTVFDDCYNANPASMSAALYTLASSVGASGRAFAILGDMLELGPEAEAMHVALGREAGARVAGLVAVGAMGSAIVRGAIEAGLVPERILATDDPSVAAAAVAAWSRPADWILVKASRGIRLERAVEALEDRLSGGSAASPIGVTRGNA